MSNKRERIADLVKTLGQILDKGTLSGAEAPTLHGQLNFAQGQYFETYYGFPAEDLERRLVR